MQTTDNHLLILAGGIGKRFWPLSRQNFPKQFHDLTGKNKSLLQLTAARFAPIIQPQNIWIVTQHSYAEEVKSQLPFLDTQQLLCEPAIKNTAPCIAYACYKIAQQNAKANLVITPADQLVQKETLFAAKIHQALQAAAHTQQLVILGTTCTQPATGYGYVMFAQQESPLKQVIQFVEKPTQAKASYYLKQGNWVWNTGILVGCVTSFIKNYQHYLPNIWRAFEAGKHLLATDSEQALITSLYQALPTLSFDHGILEKAQPLYVLFDDFGWADLGTWHALYEHLEKDAQGNVVQGNVAAVATKQCMIKNMGNQLIATYGVKDLIIVQYDKVLMICPKAEEQKVKMLVDHVKATKGAEYF